MRQALDVSFRRNETAARTAVPEDTELLGLTPRAFDSLGVNGLFSLKGLRTICVPTTGLEWLPVQRLEKRGLRLRNITDYCSESAAEFCWGLIIGLTRGIPNHRIMRNSIPAKIFPAHELNGRTLGIVGFGSIGSKVARIARAFGMRVMATDISPQRIASGVLRRSLGSLLESSDIVSLHVPLNEGTKHMIRKDAIARMRPGAYLINCARPALVEENDVADALREKRISGYAFDIGYESRKKYALLLARQDVLCVPHITWHTREAWQRAKAAWVRELIEAGLEA